MDVARACLLALSLPALALAAGTDDIESEIVALERASWAAWQSHDAKFFEDRLSGDHVEVHGYGVSGKADVVKGVGSTACTVASYSIGDFRYRRLGSDAAMLVYRAEQSTTCGGVPVPSPVWTTSVYAMREGRWVNVLFQQTPIPKG